MIPEDESRASLLPESIRLQRSDDGENVEVLIDGSGLISPYRAAKSSFQRVRVFHRIKQTVIKKVGRRSHKHHTNRYESEKENLLNIPAIKLNCSPYDERNIFSMVEDVPFDEDLNNETLSTVSSILSSASNQKTQRRLLAQWRQCMSSSIRKIIRREIEDEMKGNPPKYRDLGLYVSPVDTIYSPKPEPNHSLLFMPTLETPPGSQDEASNAGQCSNGEEFELKSKDEVAAEEVYEDVDYDPTILHPKRSSLFVSFDEDIAQLIFQAASSDTEEYQPVEVDSVRSDIEELSDRDESLLVYFHKKQDQLDRPGDAYLRNCSSSETEQSSSKPLGATSGRPNWHGYQRQQRIEEEQREVWSNVGAPILDGDVTDPPSPTRIQTSREEFWCLGQNSSSESDLTMTEVLLNRHGVFPSDFLALPKKPRVKSLLEKYPFDEDPKDEEFVKAISEEDQIKR
eukprot:CAMPEP_0194207994 /NCGR_PEP_ID=MMETSP0156-20130528/6582_1 /TAXON_ID=33649 /ORGANISM="Thalassionema nitzschioides, Strain L26-B" /LENGTH=455 /DNA_ID=CAMNT_0038934879 /DNA_START=151 /DNA_END=1519 /DNA_ORIENTATION=+